MKIKKVDRMNVYVFVATVVFILIMLFLGGKIIGYVIFPDAPDTPREPGDICTFDFSEWGECQPSGVQTRLILSQSPEGCAVGSPLLSVTCDYIPFCTPDQIILCDGIENAVVMGYKDKCDSEGEEYLGENTCEWTCSEGYQHIFDRCISDEVVASYRTELNEADLELEDVGNKRLVKDIIGHRTLLSVGVGLDISGIIILRSELFDLREYIIVRNLTLNGKTKAIYLEKKNLSSNGVCVKDSEVGSVEEIEADCVKYECVADTGSNAVCIEVNNTFIVSGLMYSGVVEVSLYCGDGACTGAESCSSCSTDCGVCLSTVTGSSGGGSDGGGGGVSTLESNNGSDPTGDSPLADSFDDFTPKPKGSGNDPDDFVFDKETDSLFIILLALGILIIIFVLLALIFYFLRKRHRASNMENLPVQRSELSAVEGISP